MQVGVRRVNCVSRYRSVPVPVPDRCHRCRYRYRAGVCVLMCVGCRVDGSVDASFYVSEAPRWRERIDRDCLLNQELTSLAARPQRHRLQPKGRCRRGASSRGAASGRLVVVATAVICERAEPPRDSGADGALSLMLWQPQNQGRTTAVPWPSPWQS